MIFELRILLYWLCILFFSYAIAKLDYHFSQTRIHFKFYDSLPCGVYYFLKVIGLLILGIWIFIQFTSYFFSGHFLFI